jgi:hypothetical protein
MSAAWWMVATAVPMLAAIVLPAWGARHWATATRRLVDRLEQGRVMAASARHDARELQGLPAVVQRYFRTALTDGQHIVNAVTLRHTGTFNLSDTAEKWIPFTSHQRATTHRPGFLWDARMAMLPGIAMRVHDAYVGGEGSLRAALWGILTMANLRGGGELARGELMRWFAEAAWYPTALLPSQGVRWEAVDEHSANATIVDAGHNVTLLFRFNDAGLIDSMRAEARGRVVGKHVTMAPWEGRWSDYRMHEGMLLPFDGEVAWMMPDGRRTYWRGSVASLVLEFAA